ncbi:MAG: archaeosortase/exosortase family protein [Acidobacteria bacterium]|nr:archaeosortase/exosortase family protein [Acidobacteriota bacterium]
MMNTRTRALVFFAVILGSLLISLEFLDQLMGYLSGSDLSSLTFMIPLMSAALILRKREYIFADINTCLMGGGAIILTGALLCAWLSFGNSGMNSSDMLSAKMLAIVLIWIGAFILLFGWASGRKALFPLLMLIFMIPIPEAWLAIVVQALQKGSARGVAILFKLTGTPYHQEGLAFMIPRTTIEIAPQCSSIRSSLALLIACLLAGHLLLKTVSRKFLLVLISIPMAMVKNAIRIVTLSLLAIHVDMGYLAGGDLHRRGGIVFFILTLLLMLPVLWVLRKTEKAATDCTD